MNRSASNLTIERMARPASAAAWNRASLRRLLRAWHDPAALSAHPLAHSRLVARRRQTHGEDAVAALRRVVGEGIEALRPAGAPPAPPDRNWRPYLALTRHYLEGQSVEAVARALCVEAVSCRRALQQGLDALGEWLRSAEDELAQESAARAPSRRPTGPLDTAPPTSARLVGRGPLLEQAEWLLLSGCRRLALHGLPGSGKSALLAHLARRPAIVRHFPDGVLWATLGAQPDTLAILNTWALALGLSPYDLERLNTPRDCARALRGLLGARRVLFAFNDVCRLQDLEPLLIGNADCAYILSTNSPQLAAGFADPRACLRVDELDLEDSLRVLDQIAPGLLPDYRQQMIDVARACGGLPLALSLIGHHLRRESYAGQSRRIEAAFKALLQPNTRLGLTQSHVEDEALPSPRSLSETIALSVSLLRADQRRALAALCVLPPRPALFDENIALALVAADGQVDQESALEAIDRLVDAGLLEHHDGAYSIHAAIVDWHAADARPRAEAARLAARRALIRHMTQALRSEEQCPLPASQWPATLTAAQAALELKWPAAAAHFADVLFDCLDRRGLRALAESLLDLAQADASALSGEQQCRLEVHRSRALAWRGDVTTAIARLEQTARRAAADAPACLPSVLLWLGQIRLRAGHAHAALAACDQALAATETPPALKLKMLTTRSAALAQLGRYDEAEAALRDAVASAQAMSQPAGEIAARLNLGALCRQRKRYDEARQHLEAGLALARQIDFRDYVLYALTALGVMAVDLGDYARAEQHYGEALPIAAELNSPPTLTLLEHALGVLDMRQGRWAPARAHLQQALDLAERHNLTWYAASVRVELGEWHLAQKEIEQADAVFARGLAIAAQQGFADLAALNRFGLARARAAQGDRVAARQLAEDSLSVLRALSHYRSDEVADWLAGQVSANDPRMNANERE